MLVLSRQKNETIVIGDSVEITIVEIKGDKVRLGINAPLDIPVHRKEVYDAIRRENLAAAEVDLANIAQAADLFANPAATQSDKKEGEPPSTSK